MCAVWGKNELAKLCVYVCVKCNSVVMEKEMVEATCLAELSFFPVSPSCPH